MKAYKAASQAPIFIAGPPRCGTTLCARILGQLPSIHAPGETHFMEDIYSRLGEIGDLRSLESRKALVSRLETIYGRFNEPSDQERIQAMMFSTDFRQGMLDSATDWQSAYSHFMKSQAMQVGARRWLNHTPKDIFYVEELIEGFPEAKFLFCVRDPRDFLLSYKQKWKATTEDNLSRIKSLYSPLVTSLLWRASATKVIDLSRKLPDSRRLIVRYETLTSNPRSTVKEMIEFIDEEFEEGYLDVRFSNSSHDSAPRTISSDSVGMWRGNLRSREIWWVEKIAAEQMEELGYGLTKPGLQFFGVVFDLLVLPFTVIRALWANRRNRGPLIPYILRRLRGLAK